MGGVLDFLFEGKPPPATTTYGSGAQNLPKWLSDYTQNLVTRANAVGAEPYQAYTGPRIAPLSPDQIASFDVTRNTVGQAPGAIAGAQAKPGALTAAQPYLDQASRTFPSAVGEYMNPYVENVINRAGTLAERQLNEKLLPGLAGVFGAGGQDARSSAYKRIADQGVRDLTEGLHEQSLGALSNAYESAGQMFGQDASRMGALAGTAGTLAGSERAQEADLGLAAQRAGLTDAAALEAIGNVQQGQTQKSLDLARQDFEEQRDYPRNTIDWQTGVLRGTPYSTSSSTASTGPADIYQPSVAAQAGSVATGIAGLLEAFKKQEARGGRIRRYRGGALRYSHA